MSAIDLSRSAHQPAKRYTSVRLQQGRVILDDDWNESESITTHERTESLVDVIGPSGTSDDALLVTNVTVAGGEVDFDLGAGTMYVGGRRLRWPEGQRYRLQDDHFDPPAVAAPAGDRNDLVWVEVAEVPVTAIEDAELREVGLGGPDTAARTRLVARVHVEEDVDADCEQAWKDTVGADVDARGVLTTDATLTVGFVPDSTPDDLCSPATTGGYLSHMNQAIRVQCTDATHFTWGFDNAAPVYRALLVDRHTIELVTLPADDAHRPRSGQVVEFLPWASVLPNGQLQGAESGQLAVVDEPFDPDTNRLTLTADLPAFGEDAWLGRPDAAELEADGRYVYMRVWERGDDTSGPEVSFTAGGAAVPLGTTGLEVSFDGTTFRRGDHWIIAARPAEPLKVVPWDLASGRLPHGPVRLRAPLAVIRWDAGAAASVHDCRRRFRPLTELQGCCDITVGDGSVSFGDVESIQEAIDRLPAHGGSICVLAGTYDERITIAGRTDVEIHGCEHDTLIAPQAGDGPVVAIDGSARVALSSLSVRALADEAVRVGLEAPCEEVTLRDLDVSASPHAAGVRVGAAVSFKDLDHRIEVIDTIVRVRDLDAPPAEGAVVELWPAVFVRGVDLSVRGCTVTANTSKVTGGLGGIQVGGLSRGVTLAANTVEGGNGHGITLGSIVWTLRDGLTDAVSDYDGFAGAVHVLGWNVSFDGGCIVIGGDPAPDDPDDPGRELVPVSTGPLEDIAIEDNVITTMAGDGIGVARFFEPTEGEEADIITVERLRIDRNVIAGNRRTAPREGSPAHTRLSGAGGIALADVTDLRVRDNRIVANGRSESIPLCGAFVLTGSALLFTGNDIVDNGAESDHDSAPRIGNRGGIVVRSSRAASLGDTTREQAPEIGAVMIHHNRISQPAGQAVWVMGVGQMSIHDNQLSAGGLAATDIFSAALRMLEGGFEGFGDVASIALAHLVGLSVTVINLGLPIDLGPVSGTDQTGPTTYLPGMAKMATLRSTLGTNAGESAWAESVEEETAVKEPVGGVDDLRMAATGIGRLYQGGHVSFADNQVTLDLSDAQISLALCSVLLLSLDDVAMHDNQIRCLTWGDLILVGAIAGALWTTRCQGNRLQEVRGGRETGVRADGLGTFWSLLTWASMNTTTSNQTSRPHRAGSFTSLLVDEHNLTWP